MALGLQLPWQVARCRALLRPMVKSVPLTFPWARSGRLYLIIRSLGVSLDRAGLAELRSRNAGQSGRRDTEGQSTAHPDDLQSVD